jgi:hypothetical protein
MAASNRLTSKVLKALYMFIIIIVTCILAIIIALTLYVNVIIRFIIKRFKRAPLYYKERIL